MILIHSNYDNSEVKTTETDENKNKTENEPEKPKKKFVGRPGDWYCAYCNNLNFAFRNECNRCRLSKYYWY